MTNEESHHDCLEDTWFCLSCNSIVPFNNILAFDVLRCPICKSDNIHQADGKCYEIKKYNGEKGTIQ